MSLISSIHPSIIKDWVTNNLSLESLEVELKQKGVNADDITRYIKEFKKQRNAKKQFKGFVLMSVGAFLGFLSCVLTILQVFPEWYSLVLYGITFVGVSIIFIGLYFVFE